MTDSQLEIVAAMTIELVKMRQDKCDYLCIENVAPELFSKLIKCIEEEPTIDVG